MTYTKRTVSNHRTTWNPSRDLTNCRLRIVIDSSGAVRESDNKLPIVHLWSGFYFQALNLDLPPTYYHQSIRGSLNYMWTARDLCPHPPFWTQNGLSWVLLASAELCKCTNRQPMCTLVAMCAWLGKIAVLMHRCKNEWRASFPNCGIRLEITHYLMNNFKSLNTDYGNGTSSMMTSAAIWFWILKPTRPSVEEATTWSSKVVVQRGQIWWSLWRWYDWPSWRWFWTRGRRIRWLGKSGHSILTIKNDVSDRNIWNKNLRVENKKTDYTVFTMINTNARPLCPKINSLLDTIEELEASLAIVTKTRLADGQTLEEDKQDLLLRAGVSMLCRNRQRDSRGLAYDGVTIFYREDMIKFNPLDFANPRSFEIFRRWARSKAIQEKSL